MILFVCWRSPEFSYVKFVSSIDCYSHPANEYQQGIILLQLENENFVVPLENLSGLITIRLDEPDLVKNFDTESELQAISAQPELVVLAKQLVDRGVQERLKGNHALAYYFYRFALLVTVQHQDIRGIDAVSGNIWILLQLLNSSKKGKSVPLSLSQNELKRQSQAAKELKTIEKMLVEDCKALLPKINQIQARLLLDNHNNYIPSLLLSLNRIAGLAGDYGVCIAEEKFWSVRDFWMLTVPLLIVGR